MKPTTRSSSANKRLIPWNNGSVGRGGPTSMDVLLGWLRSPGNYAHWHKRSARCRASSEILAMLEGSGIYHRTVRGIDSKIKKLIRSYLSAVKILREEGLPCDYLEGEDVVEDIEVVMLKECPEYRVLEPVFRGFDFRGISPKDWTTCEDSDYHDDSYGARAPKRKATGVGGRSRRSKRLRSTQLAVQGNSPAQSTVGDGDRFNQDAATDTESNAAVLTQAEDSSSSRRRVRRPGIVLASGHGKWLVTTCPDATAELRRKMEACTLEQVEEMYKLHLATARDKDECEVEVARCRLQTEQHHGELERHLDEIKLETERRRQEMQLETERRQNELKLKVDTLESRQVLKNRRVPKADIDRVLPLSALQNDP